MSAVTRVDLLAAGTVLITNFCRLNRVPVPEVEVIDRAHPYSRVRACGWYRDGQIKVKPWDCAEPADETSGFHQWSYPGYLIDRTAYGVLAHELGHHLEVYFSPSDFDGEKPISGYANGKSAETFAELARLYLTNPDLLRLVRPQVYLNLRSRFQHVESRPWREVLRAAPRKIIERCERLTKGEKS